MSDLVTVKLPIPEDYIWQAIQVTVDAIEDYGLPRRNAAGVPALCHDGLTQYAHGLAFKRQYGEWIESNMKSADRMLLYCSVGVSCEGEQWFATLQTNLSIALLLKLTFGGQL